jgi:hypothetical protein
VIGTEIAEVAVIATAAIPKNRPAATDLMLFISVPHPHNVF